MARINRKSVIYLALAVFVLIQIVMIIRIMERTLLPGLKFSGILYTKKNSPLMRSRIEWSLLLQGIITLQTEGAYRLTKEQALRIKLILLSMQDSSIACDQCINSILGILAPAQLELMKSYGSSPQDILFKEGLNPLYQDSVVAIMMRLLGEKTGMDYTDIKRYAQRQKVALSSKIYNAGFSIENIAISFIMMKERGQFSLTKEQCLKIIPLAHRLYQERKNIMESELGLNKVLDRDQVSFILENQERIKLMPLEPREENIGNPIVAAALKILKDAR